MRRRMHCTASSPASAVYGYWYRTAVAQAA